MSKKKNNSLEKVLKQMNEEQQPDNIVPFRNPYETDELTVEEVIEQIKPEKVLSMEIVSSEVMEGDPLIRFYLGDKNDPDGYCDIYEVSLTEEGANKLIKDIIDFTVNGMVMGQIMDKGEK